MTLFEQWQSVTTVYFCALVKISQKITELCRFMFSKWWTTAILNFVGSNNLTSPNDRYIKFGKDISEAGRVMTISRTNERTNQPTNEQTNKLAWSQYLPGNKKNLHNSDDGNKKKILLSDWQALRLQSYGYFLYIRQPPSWIFEIWKLHH